MPQITKRKVRQKIYRHFFSFDLIFVYRILSHDIHVKSLIICKLLHLFHHVSVLDLFVVHVLHLNMFTVVVHGRFLTCFWLSLRYCPRLEYARNSCYWRLINNQSINQSINQSDLNMDGLNKNERERVSVLVVTSYIQAITDEPPEKVAIFDFRLYD